MTHEAVLQARGLTKAFHGKTVVSDVDLTVDAGEMFGLVGPNGAGKSTVMRMCMGLLLPHAGSVELFGKPPDRLGLKRVGYMPENASMTQGLQVARVLRYLGRLKGMESQEASRVGLDLLDRFSLSDQAGNPVKGLSRGMTQMVQFVAAVQHGPDLLILDEPFSGLDPLNVRIMKDILGECRERGMAVVFSTHILPDVEELAGQVALLSGGRTLLNGDLQEMKRQHGGASLVDIFVSEVNHARQG